MPQIKVDIDKLKVYLYEAFDMSFSRTWDNLPEWVKTDWTIDANNMAKDLVKLEIVTCE